MSWAPAAASIGLGAYQAYKSSQTPWTPPVWTPPMYFGGAGDIPGGEFKSLYAQKLLGGDYETWGSGIEAKIADLESTMGESKPVIGKYLDVKTGEYDWDAFYNAYDAWTAYTGGMQTEIDALQKVLEEQGDITLPFGAIGETLGPRQVQLGEQTGAFEELGKKGIAESYDLALEDLARRGVTGGTPEFEMIQRESEAYQDLRNQAIQFGDWIQRQDDQFKIQLLGLLEGGMQASAALSWQKQQAGANLGLAQQQIQQQQAQWQQQMQWQKQQAMQNTLAMLGQGIGGTDWGNINWPGGGGGAGVNLAGSPYYSSPGSFLTRPMPTAPQYY